MADKELKQCKNVANFSFYWAVKELAHFGKPWDRRNEEKSQNLISQRPKPLIMWSDEALLTPEKDCKGSHCFKAFRTIHLSKKLWLILSPTIKKWLQSIKIRKRIGTLTRS